MGPGQDPDDIDFLDFDLDVIINTHAGPPILWRNDDGVFTDVSGQLPPPGSGSNFMYGPSACDVDGDGELDIWIDNSGGAYTEQLLINDGQGNFTDETSSRGTDAGGGGISVDGEGEPDEGACGCATVGRPSDRGLAALLVLGLGLSLARRRRRR